MAMKDLLRKEVQKTRRSFLAIGSFSMQRRQWDLEVDFAVLRRAISVWSKLSHGRIRLSMHRSITNSEVTGAKNINSHRLCEYEVKKLRSSACCRQENTIFSPHIHTTEGK